jgi:uncharacterized protein Yka (UPF0111/DUF47 family)
MRSLDRLLGDPFFDHLEAVAEQARRSIQLLHIPGCPKPGDAEAHSAVTAKSKELATQTEVKLANTVMASLKKEDIEALSRALNRIPEAAERLAQRAQLVQNERALLDLTSLIQRLNEAVAIVVSMVRLLREFDNQVPTEKLHSQLQEVVDDAENLAEKIRSSLYRQEPDPIKLLTSRDFLDRATDIAGLCGECGDLAHQVVLKYG